MRHYCTYFDRNYLVRALAMYASLREHSDGFELTVLCLDQDTTRLLEAMKLPHVHLIRLQDLEHGDIELLAAKSNRSRLEYLWTLTPSLLLFLLKHNPSCEMITYLDADLYYYSSPEPIFRELGDYSISLIPHRYSHDVEQGIRLHGVFNVGMMSFRRDRQALAALEWWRARCNEACHSSYRDGKFGDQKYLDDWPSRFPGVKVIQNVGANLATWNIRQYTVAQIQGRLLVNSDDLIFYHFHALDIFSECWFRIGEVGPSASDVELIYRPYFRALQVALQRIRAIDPGFTAGFARPTIKKVLVWCIQFRLNFLRQPTDSMFNEKALR